MLDFGGFGSPRPSQNPFLNFPGGLFLRVLEPRWAKIAPRAPKSPPRALQEAPKSLQEPSKRVLRADVWSMFDRLWMHFWYVFVNLLSFLDMDVLAILDIILCSCTFTFFIFLYLPISFLWVFVRGIRICLLVVLWS